ncbi:MAG: radical SAM protein [Bryobacteraceae bacterium]
MRLDRRLGLLFHHFVPASLYGGATAFPTLSQIEPELRRRHGSAAAAAAAERFKPDLFARLRSRFELSQAQALTLKILNLCLAKYHFQTRSTSVLSRPYGLVVDPSDMCQLACPGCVHSDRSQLLKIFDWHNGTLPEERFAALLKRYGPYAIGVYFCNYGEPLLNLHTPKLIRMAKSYLMGTALSTSLSVKRLDADAYVTSGLDFMVLSIDGATQPTYQRFRRNGNLELVFDNVRKLVNAHEIPLAARNARKLGVDHFRVVNPFDVAWDDPEIRPAAVKGGVRRLDWLALSNQPENWNPFPDSVDADTIARAFENPWDPHAAGDSPPSEGHTCHWLYKNMVMDATGRIMPCCGAPRKDTNLVFATFGGNGDDPFNSEKYRQARNIGGPEIRRYFRAADAAFFDRRSLQLLSDW